MSKNFSLRKWLAALLCTLICTAGIFCTAEVSVTMAPQMMKAEDSLKPAPTPTPYIPGLLIFRNEGAYEDNHLDPAVLDIPDDGMPIPRLFQRDYKTPVCSVFGVNKSVHTSGCGAAAASMVIAYTLEEYRQTPYTLFHWAVKNSHYFGYGLHYDSIQEMLAKYGIDSYMENIDRYHINEALQANRPIIIKMGPGTFTNSGHYIVLRGLDKNGMVLVNDSSSTSRSEWAFPVSLIINEAKDATMLVVLTPAKNMPSPKPHIPAQPTMEPAMDTPKGEPATVITDRVNLRQHPVNGGVSEVVRRGAQLYVLQETEIQADGYIWYCVMMHGEMLYVRSDMLSMHS